MTISEILDSIKDKSPLDQRKYCFEFCQNLAYGDIGSRDPMEVLSQQKGTCSGKNDLLKILLEALGYSVKTFFQFHDYSKFNFISFPEGLEKYKQEPIWDYTNFLKIKINGNWVKVSCTFEKELIPFGFPVSSWDGESSMKLPFFCIGDEIESDKENMDLQKKELLQNKLTKEELVYRKNFLKDLTNWLDERR